MLNNGQGLTCAPSERLTCAPKVGFMGERGRKANRGGEKQARAIVKTAAKQEGPTAEHHAQVVRGGVKGRGGEGIGWILEPGKGQLHTHAVPISCL